MLHKLRFRLPFSTWPVRPVSLAIGTVAFLSVAYIGLIAVVMSYAALTVESSQSVRNDEASVAELEGQYLAAVAEITTMDYAAAGYVVPLSKTFVRAKSTTALR